MKKLDTVSNIRHNESMATRRRHSSIRVAILRSLKKSGWSVKRLAEESGVPYSSTHGFIVNDRKATLGSAEQWCHALGLEVVSRRTRKAR